MQQLATEQCDFLIGFKGKGETIPVLLCNVVQDGEGLVALPAFGCYSKSSRLCVCISW